MSDKVADEASSTKAAVVETTVDTKSNENAANPASLPTGPLAGVEYPLTVTYCGFCTLPLEYCVNWGTLDKCREWLSKNLPDEFAKLSVDSTEDGDESKQSKSGKRGGKGLVREKKKNTNNKIEIFRSNRGKKKFVTVIRGLGTFEIDLKEASKFFASKFACGSSVTGKDEIVVQGDVKDELFDYIPEKWSSIDEDLIEDLGDKKY